LEASSTDSLHGQSVIMSRTNHKFQNRLKAQLCLACTSGRCVCGQATVEGTAERDVQELSLQPKTKENCVQLMRRILPVRGMNGGTCGCSLHIPRPQSHTDKQSTSFGTLRPPLHLIVPAVLKLHHHLLRVLPRSWNLTRTRFHESFLLAH